MRQSRDRQPGGRRTPDRRLPLRAISDSEAGMSGTRFLRRRALDSVDQNASCADCREAGAFRSDLHRAQPDVLCSWRTGGARPRGRQESLSFSRGHQAHDVVAGCVRHQQSEGRASGSRFSDDAATSRSQLGQLVSSDTAVRSRSPRPLPRFARCGTPPSGGSRPRSYSRAHARAASNRVPGAGCDGRLAGDRPRPPACARWLR
jgi:hypothetical protein